MRRWNGWGDDTINFELNADALAFLTQQIGSGTPVADAAFEQACAQIRPTRLAPHRLISTEAAARLHNALGQSLPDWLRLRYGVIDTAPDGVAYPESAADVRELLAYAGQFDVALIPHGGGTSVASHLSAPAGARPSLAVNLTRLRAMSNLDTQSQLATFGAGVFGPDLEAQLRAHGYTLGHFPQSFEYSTLGGWIVTRSSGQQSLRYGRIERLFAGGSVETPAGTLDIPTFPASAAGTDLREMVLGSEGRLGILIEATVRVTPLPEYESFHAVFFPDWARAEAAVREVVQGGLSLSMLRLSNPLGTLTMLALAGHKKLIAALEAWLRRGQVHADDRRQRPQGRSQSRAVRRAGADAAPWRCPHRPQDGRQMEAEPLPQCLPAQRRMEPRLRHRHCGDGGRLAARSIDDEGGGGGGHRRAGGTRRARTHVYPPVAFVRAGRQRLHHFRLSLGRELRNGPGPLAQLETCRQRGDRRQWRDHQPPARRRQRPCTVSGGGEGRVGHRRDACPVPPLRPAIDYESRYIAAVGK